MFSTMPKVAIVLCTLFPLAVAATTTPNRTSTDIFAPTLPPAIRSQKCSNEVNVLVNNANLNQASVVEVGIECLYGSCKVDYKVHDEFQNLCIQAGGKFYQKAFTLDCSDGSGHHAHATNLNLPICGGESCSPTDVAEYFDSKLARLDQIPKFYCKTAFGSTVSAGMSKAKGALAMFSALTLISFVFVG